MVFPMSNCELNYTLAYAKGSFSLGKRRISFGEKLEAVIKYKRGEGSQKSIHPKNLATMMPPSLTIYKAGMLDTLKAHSVDFCIVDISSH